MHIMLLVEKHRPQVCRGWAVAVDNVSWSTKTQSKQEMDACNFSSLTILGEASTVHFAFCHFKDYILKMTLKLKVVNLADRGVVFTVSMYNDRNIFTLKESAKQALN